MASAEPAILLAAQSRTESLNHSVAETEVSSVEHLSPSDDPAASDFDHRASYLLLEDNADDEECHTSENQVPALWPPEKEHMVALVLGFILCFPLALFAIFKTYQAQHNFRKGDIETAKSDLRLGKSVAVTGIIVGGLAGLFLLIRFTADANKR